jgi:succinate-semialdehyde dehydrogenase/glutarate-semialdehyde dehydrogenase
MAMYPQLYLYIDGQFLDGVGRESEPVINPATGQTLTLLPHATPGDLDQALAAAARGFLVWKRWNAYDRAKLMAKAADLIRERIEAIARTMTLEQGKVLAEARAEILHAADLFDWYGQEGRRTYGRVVPGRDLSVRQTVLMEPVGPVAAFTPWNFPALTPARKLAGALGAGCSIVLKAAEETPGTALALIQALHDAGLPPGVANLVFGAPAEVSARLIADPVIKKITFTGSTPVGRHLLRLAADGAKRATMELGGNAPVLVFADADLEAAVATCVAGKYRNAGQVCVSPSRFFVQESVYDRFVEGFVKGARAAIVGDGLDPSTTMGPLANARRLEAMDRVVADALARGGKVRTGGGRIGDTGYFFQPTVVTDMGDDALLLCDETFGPVAPITPFKTFDEVIARANAVPQGLAGYAFTCNSRIAADLADTLQTGMLGINTFAVSTPETPFGGVKESGYGREGGIEGLQAYLHEKLVVQA